MLVEVEQHPPYLRPYAAAVRRRGAGVGAVLWASRYTQTTRFEAMLKLADPTGRSVLDLGCGCGDLLDFFLTRGAAPTKYVGLEGVGELAAAAAARPREFANVQIVHADFVH